MNELTVFEYNAMTVRTVEQNGEPWFVLKDVCAALKMDTSKLKQVADRLDEDERGRYQIPTPGGMQETWIVNESGLYNVILRSDKPEAKPFRKWVTGTVLPSIRKHGGYIAGQENLNDEDFLAKALVVAQKVLADREARISTLSVQNQIMQPKADYFDELVERNTLTNFRETAQQLGIGQKNLVKFLIDKKYLYRDKKGKLLPYSDKNNGLFEVKECYNEKTQWSGTQTLVTPKGRETFRLLILAA